MRLTRQHLLWLTVAAAVMPQGGPVRRAGPSRTNLVEISGRHRDTVWPQA
jgi:hypothetical protein